MKMDSVNFSNAKDHPKKKGRIEGVKNPLIGDFIKIARKRMRDSYKKLFCFECFDKLPDAIPGNSNKKINASIKKYGWTIWGNAKSNPPRLYLICKKCK